MKKLNTLLFVITLGFIIGCSSEPKEDKKTESNSEKENQDTSEPVSEENINQDWIDVQSKVSRMDEKTSYDQIVELLGKPYDEYISPSTPEEYILFYNVPGVNGAIFWLVLETESKSFRHWSGEKNEK